MPKMSEIEIYMIMPKEAIKKEYGEKLEEIKLYIRNIYYFHYIY